MKLKEAIFKMILGDKWKTLKQGKTLEKIGECEFRWESGSELSMLGFLQYSDQEGEIIPAEPKVLTADEIYNHEMSFISGDIIPDEKFANIMIKSGHKNGRLEMWMEFKNYLDNKKWNETSISFPFSLKRAVEELKP